jgi:hypothetical protein
MSEVKVDTISERTTDAGVTIEGVKVEDGVATFQTAAGSPLVFEGATADAFETTFAFTDPTADRTITFPDSSFTVPTTGGKVLQVLEHNLATSISTTSTSYVASGLTITITPASTASRFLLTLSSGRITASGAGTYAETTFYVDTGSGAAEVSDAGSYATYRQCNSVSPTMVVPHSSSMIHAPATVSATTYTVYYKTSAGTCYFNDTVCRVVFTVMELSS